MTVWNEKIGTGMTNKLFKVNTFAEEFSRLLKHSLVNATAVSPLQRKYVGHDIEAGVRRELAPLRERYACQQQRFGNSMVEVGNS